jgi:cytosine/adenosine deaminase-related metal-dependent hydrolase
METVHDTDAVFEALVPTGLRAVVGKCLMDVRGDAPARLVEDAAPRSTKASRSPSAGTARRTDVSARRSRRGSRSRARASCSRPRPLVSAARGWLVHTHASEQREEIDVVRAATGQDNLVYLASLGLATERLCAAHCVWATDTEQAILAERRVKVLHCPGSNVKLGSGIAPVPEMRARGISVSLGADGAACNNTLDMFHEMRMAATLQAVRRGPGSLPARDVVWMATREGARALGLDAEIGSIEPARKPTSCSSARTGSIRVRAAIRTRSSCTRAGRATCA